MLFRSFKVIKPVKLLKLEWSRMNKIVKIVQQRYGVDVEGHGNQFDLGNRLKSMMSSPQFVDDFAGVYMPETEEWDGYESDVLVFNPGTYLKELTDSERLNAMGINNEDSENLTYLATLPATHPARERAFDKRMDSLPWDELEKLKKTNPVVYKQKQQEFNDYANDVFEDEPGSIPRPTL